MLGQALKAVCRPTQGSQAIQPQLRGSFKASERRHTTKGKFLLLTAQEALQSLECEPTAAVLNEAYADAAYFKQDLLSLPLPSSPPSQ